MERRKVHSGKRGIAIFGMAIPLLCACGSASGIRAEGPSIAASPSSAIAFEHAAIIDGTGTGVIADGTVLVRGATIAAVGPAGCVPLPEGCLIVDATGATLLPGFINAHVHGAYDPRSAATWAAAGVTTVRDLSCGRGEVARCLAFRDLARDDPRLCRVVAAGSMIVVAGGYESRYGIQVRSVDDAIAKTGRELDEGVDFVKITLQRGGFLVSASLPPETAAAIVGLAHERERKAVAHVRRTVDLDDALDCGIDDVAHVVEDRLPEETIGRMVAAGVPMEPTLTNWELSRGRARKTVLDNVKRFVDAGGILALGSEYIPSAKVLGPFAGMPIAELLMMREAGMTPMQVIVASTRNAAVACGIDGILGTIEPGKIADIILVRGDPLADLRALSRISLVMHGGTIIRGMP
jgi:imidazolonepropionase-like amidohydrolase